MLPLPLSHVLFSGEEGAGPKQSAGFPAPQQHHGGPFPDFAPCVTGPGLDASASVCGFSRSSLGALGGHAQVQAGGKTDQGRGTHPVTCGLVRTGSSATPAPS